jgi:hypothetical protein
VLLPLAVAAATGYPLSRFWFGLAVGLGIVALAGLVLLPAISPRLPSVAGRVGVGRVLRFRRMAGTAILAAVLLHPLAFIAGDLPAEPRLALGRLAAMFVAPGLTTGVLAAGVLVAVAGIGRIRRLPLSERLRAILCGTGIVIAALLAFDHALSIGTFAAESAISAAWAILVAVALLAAGALLQLRLARPRLVAQGGRRLGPDLVEILARPAGGDATFRAGAFFRTANPNAPGDALPLGVGSAPEDLPVLRLVVAEPDDLERGCHAGRRVIARPGARRNGGR